MSSCVFLTPEGVLSTVAQWQGDSTYVSPQVVNIKPVAGAPSRMGLKHCTVWTTLREMPSLSHAKMAGILPHCAESVQVEEFQKMKNIIENDSCVKNLWCELENSRENKRQKKHNELVHSQ